jgi:hypothetical protein
LKGLPVSDLTKQEIDLLMDCVRSWASSPDAKGIASEVLGCLCPRCCPDPDAVIAKVQERQAELISRLQAEVYSRREVAQSMMDRLLSMRDSIVADEFFASIPETQPPAKHGI